jgi:hypothetical protein
MNTKEKAHQDFLLQNTDFEVRSLDTISVNESELKHPWWYNFKYAIAGLLFGIFLVKAEVISWFRIQEMVQVAELSYVWCNRLSHCNRDDIGMAY